MANANAQWWYERNGAQAGPVAFAVLQQLAATGELKPSTMVWTAGMSGWAPAQTVEGLRWPPPAEPVGTPPPPPLSEAGAQQTATPSPAGSGSWGAAAPAPSPSGSGSWKTAAPSQPARSAAEAVQPVGDINVTTTILLSVVTLAIYGVVKFFQTGKAYERLVGRETRFTPWFWAWVGCTIASALLHLAGPLGPAVAVAAIVFQFLTLYEALKARNDGMRRWNLQVAVTSDTTHYVLLAIGLALSPIIVGIVLLIVQAVKWFQDWNAIRHAALRRPSAQTPVFAPGVPAQRTS